jgi:N6-L-threonylcarbamoyladenine synthase
MVLLASGGHCILGIAEDVDKFYRLGETIDIAPGEAFDKVSKAFFVTLISCMNVLYY